LSFSALDFFVECEEGVLVKMCIVDKLDGGWCIGGFQEQIRSPVKEISFLLLSRRPPRWNLLGWRRATLVKDFVFMKHSRPFWPVVMYPILEKLTPVSYD
jgi:hypothetical protein